MLVLTVATGMEVSRLDGVPPPRRILDFFQNGIKGTAGERLRLHFFGGDNNKPCSVVMPEPNLNEV